MADLISVIIPVYNVEPYLKRCVSSVLAQTHDNIEIILIDDGATDNSGKICDELAMVDSRIHVIHQENMGLSGARNTGLQHISGSYVYFLDSDDWITPDCLEYLLKMAQQYDADMVVGGIERTAQYSCDNDGRPTVEEVLNQADYAKRYFKIDHQTIEYYVWNKLYKRSVVEGVMYPVSFYAEDVPTTFEYILKSTRIVTTTKRVHYYFVNTQGLTANFTVKHFDVLKGWNLVCESARTFGNSQYMIWAEYNRKRADLALLTEIAMSANYKSLVVELKPQIIEMKTRLALNKKVLLQGSLPFSRKILVQLFSLNYEMFAGIIHVLMKMMKQIRG